MSRKTMEMALDCLLYYNRREAYPRPESPTSKTIEALRAALAESAGAEPVAWYHPSGEGYDSAFRDHRTVMACTGGDWSEWIPLYTHPPAREAELSDEEVIGEYGWQGTSRQWWTGGAWLEPDDMVIVRRAAARGKG